jgi:hypothetical protein
MQISFQSRNWQCTRNTRTTVLPLFIRAREKNDEQEWKGSQPAWRMILWYVNLIPTNSESRCCSNTDGVVGVWPIYYYVNICTMKTKVAYWHKMRKVNLTKVLFRRWIEGSQGERIVYNTGKAQEICKHSLWKTCRNKPNGKPRSVGKIISFASSLVIPIGSNTEPCLSLSSLRVFPDHRGMALTTPRQRQVRTLTPPPPSWTLAVVTLLIGRDRLNTFICSPFCTGKTRATLSQLWRPWNSISRHCEEDMKLPLHHDFLFLQRRWPVLRTDRWRSCT